MPLVNYCRKCKTETPLGQSCPHCGGKLAQTGEQLSFGVVRTPVRDWFAWNSFLRIVLPALLLVLLVAVVAEAAAGGAAGVALMLSQGFFWTLMIVLGVSLVLICVVLWLQGTERVHYLLDREGVHARTYLCEPDALRLYARFLSEEAVERLQAEDARPPLEGLALVRRVTIPWSGLKRVRVWREGGTLLFFRPTFWQVLAIRCPAGELAEAEGYVRKKLKRVKKARVQPRKTRK